MKQKREEFRQQIRKQENEKIFQRLRCLINNQRQTMEKMISTEQEFYENLQNQINTLFDDKQLLNCLKKWEDYFDKKQMTQLLFHSDSQYFKFLVANFKMTKKYIRIFIYIFQTLEYDKSEVHVILNEYQFLNRLLKSFSNEEAIIQQQLMFLFSVLIQYSQFYRFAIKNSNIIDIVLEQFINKTINMHDNNYLECFIFMIWSLINPDINLVSDLFEWIFDDLVRLFLYLENFSSDYLLAIIFKASASFTFCRYKLFQFDQKSICQQQFFLNKPLIQSEYIGFINILLNQEPECFIPYFSQYYLSILVILIENKNVNIDLKTSIVQLFIDSLHYNEILTLLLENKIVVLILNMVLETFNIDLIQVQIILLSQLLEFDHNKNAEIEQISKSLTHIISINSQFQYIYIWNSFRYFISQYSFSQQLIQNLKEQNIINIMENCLEISNNTNVTQLINECIEIVK